MKNLTLRLQISMIMVAALVVALAVTSWLTFDKSRQVVQDLTLDKIMAQTRQSAELIDSAMVTTRAAVVVTPDFPPIPGLIRCWDNTENPGQDPVQVGSNEKIWIERLGQILKTQMRQQPLRIWSAVYNESGAGVMRVQDNGMGELVVMDSNLTDVSQQEFFLRTKSLKPGDVYVSPMRLEGQTVVVRFATPFFNKADGVGNDRQARGVFVIAIDGRKLISRVVKSLDTVEGTKRREWVEMVDETGQYLFSNDPYNPSTAFSSDRFADYKPVRARLLQQQDMNGDYNRSLDNYRAFIQGTDRTDGQGINATYIRIYYNAPLDRSRFWVVAQSQAAEVGMEPVAKLGWNLLWVGLTVALIGAAITYWLAGRLTASLSLLARHADEIARGHLDTPPPELNPLGEVRSLNNSFRSMTEELRSIISSSRAQEARTQAIIDSTADSLITIDEHGKVLSSNAATERVFGFNREQLMGKKASVLVSDLYDEDAQYDNGDLQPGEMRILGGENTVRGNRIDGSIIPVAMRVAEMNHEGEKLFIATMQDVSERVRAEEERERLFEAIQDAVRRLNTASNEILATTSEQSAGAQQQASTVSELVATAEEIARSANQSLQRSSEVADSARHTGEVGSAGKQAVEDSILAMQDVKQHVESLANNIVSLAERAQTISEITTTVNDIAEQSNVLALNAAVEASRAGEHGKGFAVVAQEVKSLAEQSKKATAQVRKILHEIQKATNDAVRSTENGSQSVNSASKIITKAGETITSLAATLAESARSAAQISAYANQQAAGVGQLSDGVKNIDNVAQLSLQAIQQVEHSAQNLNALSNELTSLTAAQ